MVDQVLPKRTELRLFAFGINEKDFHIHVTAEANFSDRIEKVTKLKERT